MNTMMKISPFLAKNIQNKYDLIHTYAFVSHLPVEKHICVAVFNLRLHIVIVIYIYIYFIIVYTVTDASPKSIEQRKII